MNSDNLKKMISKESLFNSLLILLLIVFLYLQFNIWFGENSYSKLSKLKKDITEKEVSNRELAKKNADLKEEKNRLTSGKSAIEGLARSELGLIKSGETFYKFKFEDDTSQESAPNKIYKDK